MGSWVQFYGPFQIVQCIGEVAYKLKLPGHDAFHIGLLKKFNGTPWAARPLLPLVHHGRACLKPAAVMRASAGARRAQAPGAMEGPPGS
jgi:hypothetical protein